MTKRPFGHGPLQWMGNFKAVQADYEYYLSLSDKPVSICITPRQMYILSVQNTYTAWFSRWYNTDDISAAVVQEIAAELEDLLMCGCGVPAPSLTDRLNSITYNNSTTTIYQTTENTWNAGGQTISSIAPDLDYDTGDPGNIAKLICAALRNLLNAIVNQGKQMNQQTAEQNIDLVGGLSDAMGGLSAAGGAALAVGGAAAGAVGFFGGPWLLLGLALASVGMKIATLFMGADQSVFEDKEAIEKVACVLINNTSGENMTRAVFQGALTPNDFAPGSHEATIAAFVQPYLDDLTVYLQFLQLGNQLYGVSNFAEMPDCGCGPVGCVIYDFAADGSQGWDGGFGTVLIPSVGWERSDYNNITIFRPAAPFTVHTIEATFTVKQPSSVAVYAGPSGMTKVCDLAYSGSDGKWVGTLVSDIAEGDRIEVGATGPIDDGILTIVKLCPPD